MMGSCCEGFGGNNWLWIILLLLCGNNGNGCGNGCSSDGNSWWWIILLLLLCGGCGNSIGACEAK